MFLRKKYHPVDRIKAKPLRVEINKTANIKPTNCMTPADIPIHLRKAVDKELKEALEAGFLEHVFMPQDGVRDLSS